MGIKSSARGVIKEKPINESIKIKVFRCRYYSLTCSSRCGHDYFLMGVPKKEQYDKIEEKEIKLTWDQYKCLTPGAINSGLNSIAESLWGQAAKREHEIEEDMLREERKHAWESIGRLFWEKSDG